MKSLNEANIVKGMRVIIRCDIDVPIENGQIMEPLRLERGIPSLKYIIEQGGFPVIIGHMGKPDGKYVAELSTKSLLHYYNEALGENNFELLENLRFDPGEESNDPLFAKKIAQYGAIYVNDSFGVSHRKHASILGIPAIMDSYSGLELQSEVNALRKVLNNPEKPLVAIVGGAKIESKLPTITNLLKIADNVLVGGKIGLEWKESIPQNLLLPLDYGQDNKDIGPATIEKYCELIQQAKTIVWAGPMGLYEDPNFIEGTNAISIAINKATKNGAFSVVGGGDTIAALDILGLLNDISFISTGGGAMLEFLANGTLPGIEALN